MKLLVFGSLFALMLSSAIAPVTIARSQNISPFNLAHLARRGYFRKHEIPSYSALCAAVMTRRVSVRDVMKAAIAQEIFIEVNVMKRILLSSLSILV
jgi:hypothetical protein